MNARFRVRLRDGGDLMVDSLEGFFERVAEGVIGRHDLIHDALTDEWAPAGMSPVYWLCADLLSHGIPPGELGLQEEAAWSPGAPAPSQDGGEAEATPSDPSLELVPATPGPNPEDAAKAFIAQMHEERAQQGDAPQALGELATLAPAPPPVASAPPASPAPRRRVAVGPPPQDDPHRGASAAEEPAPSPQLGPRPRPRRYHQATMGLALVLGFAGVVGGVGLAWPGIGGGGVTAVEEAVAHEAPRVLPPTEEEVRAASYQAFLAAVATMAQEAGVDPVPDAWLEGRYLADAAAYPEVEAYWQAYGAYVEAVQAGERDLFRGAYLDQADAAGLSGPVRSLRLATAQADFAAAVGARAVVYARVQELVRAALALHTLSAQAAGRISYEPARANRISADPVIEAAATDEDMQGALDAALDRVLLALHGEVEGEGPGREGAPGWLVEALRDVGR